MPSRWSGAISFGWSPCLRPWSPLPKIVKTAHPLGCYNPRIPDRIVFERVMAALVHGSGYERIAGPDCSDRTIRRRVKYWAELGLPPQLYALALRVYDRVIGLELGELSVDGCITKAPAAARQLAGPRWTGASKG
ncbi:hypothetical protein M878_44220 [Streptomyces roseochromogenus subsp. oscitans DS 12.976]|uniref:Transposase n=1 Tax=Streptomyces roseochromogenus subsp. oscitans DS 12.976 TaxID=1352936 RepID=V6JGE4_STRRC|nr:hypothetical protein M878_44220 [Streptomyces roseochromogenus subsp. oscitans DS 12.976]